LCLRAFSFVCDFKISEIFNAFSRSICDDSYENFSSDESYRMKEARSIGLFNSNEPIRI
jgi:hypothetical protein